MPNLLSFNMNLLSWERRSLKGFLFFEYKYSCGLWVELFTRCPRHLSGLLTGWGFASGYATFAR